MGKPRACDVCSLRKIRCSGECPCVPCVKAQFDCSFAKTPMKPGPKGPRAATSTRIRKKPQDIRSQAAISTTGSSPRSGKISAATRSFSPSFSPRLQEGSSLPCQTWRALSPTLFPPTSDLLQISFRIVSAYLNIYHHRMYAVWPVVDVTKLLARLSKPLEDPEACALAYSVCAATGVQLRLADFEPENSQNGFSILLASVSSRNSKSLALLQDKMAATNGRFQQIPRLIEVEDDFARSPVSLEPTLTHFPTETSSELETKQLCPAPTSASFQHTHKALDDSTSNFWLDGTGLPELSEMNS